MVANDGEYQNHASGEKHVGMSRMRASSFGAD